MKMKTCWSPYREVLHWKGQSFNGLSVAPFAPHTLCLHHFQVTFMLPHSCFGAKEHPSIPLVNWSWRRGECCQKDALFPVYTHNSCRSECNIREEVRALPLERHIHEHVSCFKGEMMLWEDCCFPEEPKAVQCIAVSCFQRCVCSIDCLGAIF